MSVEDRLVGMRDAFNGRRDQVRDRTQELVDAALDRIFAEPLVVPDAATALRLLSDDRLIEDSEDVGARMARFDDRHAEKQQVLGKGLKRYLN